MNITLIGMPGCGKSTVGSELARSLSMHFVDTDLVIMEKTGCSLKELLDQLGDDGFRELENRFNAELDVTDSVISPGGSVVYGQKAMEHLRQISTVIYLDVSLQALQQRLGDLHDRGVTLRPGQTLESLMRERDPLYRQYAHDVLPADGLQVQELAEELSKMIRK